MAFIGFGKIAGLFVALLLVVSVTAVSFNSGNLFSKENSQMISDEELNKVFSFATQEAEKLVISNGQKELNYKRIENELEKSERVGIIAWVYDEYSVEGVINELEGFETKYFYNFGNGFAGSATADNIEKLKKDERVNYVVFDEKVEAHLLQSRTLIQANLVENNLGLAGQGIGVCHLDTGVNYNHPYLSIVGGYDVMNNDPDPMDDNGHGTNTVGVIKSTHSLVRGVAPNASIVALKVLNSSGNGYSSDIAAGIDWCISNKDSYNIRVVTMSLGTLAAYNPSNSPASYDPTLLSAKNNGMSIVASAGNNGNINGISYPAVSPHTISVGATYDANNLGSQTFISSSYACTDSITSADKVTCYSNRASFLDIIAPGSSITTANIIGSFGSVVGTSLAAPHVAGTIALMYNRNPNLHHEQVRNILVNSGVPVLDSATGLTFPRVNSLNAVNNVPRLSVSGPLAPGTLITFNINAPQEPGLFYALLLSTANSPGIPLDDGTGRIIPLAPDTLLYLTLDPSFNAANGFLNTQGFLSSNGSAQATLQVPNVPGIQNVDLYAAFATVNFAQGTINSVSNYVVI